MQKKQNIEFMHLGGGNIDDNNDKLFKFKNSMSTNNHKYYIGKRIITNPKIYKLKKAWKEKYPILYDRYSKDYFVIILIQKLLIWIF